jgi:polyphosphate kinase 2 (PPK2 family)
MLVCNGISLTKFWFSVSPSEQHTRFLLSKFDHDDKDHELVGGPERLSLLP